MEKEHANRRTGDKIAISGDYQYNAFYHGSALQRYWHRFKLATAIKNLDPKDGDQVLDAGCGSGILSALIASPFVWVTGLDGNPDAIAFCRQKWGHLPNTRYLLGPIDHLRQFADNSFDGIAFLEVVEHLTGAQAANVISEFHRILKPAGVLVLSTPNRKSPWPLLEKVMDLLHLAPNQGREQHEKLYSGRELEALARSAGLIPVKRQRINFIAPWLAAVSKKWAEKMHAWESRQHHLPGCLLVYTFIKPAGRPNP